MSSVPLPGCEQLQFRLLWRQTVRLQFLLAREDIFSTSPLSGFQRVFHRGDNIQLLSHVEILDNRFECSKARLCYGDVPALRLPFPAVMVALLITCVFLLRLPSALVPRELNQDESQMLEPGDEVSG